MPCSAWLVDPVPEWLAGPAVLALLLCWGALTAWAHRRKRPRGMVVTSGLVLLGMSALVAAFALRVRSQTRTL